jgi:hypothetical protein
MARSFQALVQQSLVYFPKTEWADSLIGQLCKFPAGKYDDGVDACSLFGRYIDRAWKANRPERKEKPLKISDRPVLRMADFHEDEIYG